MAKLITEEGLKKIKEELENRKTKVRQKIADAIKEAKEQGDLSENAEYSEAKHQQAENEARVAELEFMLKEAKVVTYDAKATGLVQMGSKVSVKMNGCEMDFQIVGSNEAGVSFVMSLRSHRAMRWMWIHRSARRNTRSWTSNNLPLNNKSSLKKGVKTGGQGLFEE